MSPVTGKATDKDFTANMTIHILYGIVGQLKSPVQSIMILTVESFIEFAMHFSVNSSHHIIVVATLNFHQ